LIKPIKFTEQADADIWADLHDTEAKARIVKESPLFQALMNNKDVNWCCANIKRLKTPRIAFSDGTKLRVHYCPRCGREL
jgi:hypothetical protein